MTDRTYHDAYLPSPEEIAEACEKIQARWTQDEKHRRTGGTCESNSEADTCQEKKKSNASH